MFKKLSPKSKKVFLFLILIIGSIYLVIIHLSLLSSKTPGDPKTTFPFLSLRIFTEQQNDLLINFIPLRSKLREMVVTDNDSLGFYFEYLPTGSSIGINDKVDHEFASLIKVPVVMAYYSQVRNKQVEIDQTFEIQQTDLADGFGNLWQKPVGTKITAKEVITAILTQSDNTATNILVRNIEPQYLKQIFDNLDITLSKDKSGYQAISAKSYSSIFKSLYLSSNLDKTDSNEILEILTRSVHRDIIKAGVPSEVQVAHKMGMIEDKLLWDCGIIYVPKRPYLLCAVSTDTTQRSKDRIAEISKTIYDYIRQIN